MAAADAQGYTTYFIATRTRAVISPAATPPTIVTVQGWLTIRHHMGGASVGAELFSTATLVLLPRSVSSLAEDRLVGIDLSRLQRRRSRPFKGACGTYSTGGGEKGGA